MIVSVDLGNTSIHVGCFRHGRLRRQADVPTSLAQRPAALTRRLRSLVGGRGTAQRPSAILCTVVPAATGRVVQALRQAGARSVQVVGRHVRVPLKNRYAKPRQVGQDRLVGAYAAWRRYRATCIIVDVGTAVTIDVVTRRGEYLGGVIAPGLEVARDALSVRAALLPAVRLQGPVPLLGRDTVGSIRAGLIRGTAALCEGLVRQLKQRYGPPTTVLLTGGSASLLRPYLRLPHRWHPHLVLEGLLDLHRLTR